MYSLLRRLLFNNARLKFFSISRLADSEITEQVFLKKGKYSFNITTRNGMICLDPFCIAVWIPKSEMNLIDPQKVNIQFYKGQKISAAITVSLIENIDAEKSALLLYKIEGVRNYQFTALHRVILFAYLLRNKTSTYKSRKTISALYSYPRKIIIVSYKDEGYCNIFPMDIHGYMQEDGMYILGLRTTNKTLDKILKAKKVVVCDTNAVDINTVYTLGKHPSAAPPKIEGLPFSTTDSELFKFPVPDFTGTYKEIEIIMHKKMGFHMLMVGKVVNLKMRKQDTVSLYHIGFLEGLMAKYYSIEGTY